VREHDGYWADTIEVQCPYCGERVVYGTLVQDCEVCCNPWSVTITRDRDGDPDVRVERAQ
jgi:Cysteine-rich CPXCG